MTGTSTIDLDAETEILEGTRSWASDLRRRIWRARLQFELIGLDPEEQDLLVDEVKRFKRVCRALRWGRA
jgi:hypothetical protein